MSPSTPSEPPRPDPLLDEPVSHVQGYEVPLDEPDKHWSASRWRRSVGYGLGGVAIAGVGAAFWYSLWLLSKEAAPVKDIEEKFRLGQLAAHALISVAGIYFGYQLMRVAERLVVPHWWKPPMVRAMLGVERPLSGMALRRVLAIVRSIAQERKDD